MIRSLKGSLRRVRSAGGLVVLALSISSVLFFCDLLRGRYLLTERDLGPYFIPPRFFWIESLKNGDFPLWNPYQFSGHPFLANPQNSVLYPFHAIFFLLPFDIAFNVVIILHFFLGGIFTYLLLRDLRVNPTGSLISSLIFMLSGYLLSVHSLLTILLSVIWTPLIIMFFRRALANPGFKNEILAAVFFTFSFLGGGIEIIYGNFFVLFLMIFFPLLLDDPHSSDGESSSKGCQETSKMLENPPLPSFTKGGVGGLGRWRKVARSTWLGLRSLSIVIIIFVLLSAIQLIPFLELWMYSIRRNGLSYQEATLWSFAPKDMVLFFFPDAYGYFLDMKKYWVTQCWLKTLYTGGLPFVLGFYFFLFGKGRRLFIALMLFSLFLSLGQYNPLYPFVFRYVPFINGIRYPVKFLYIFILCLSIIAGLGFQRLTELSKEGGHKRFKNFLMVLSFASVLLLLFLILGYKEIYHFLKGRGFDIPDFNYLFLNLHHAQRSLFYLCLFFLLLRVGHEVRWKGWAGILLVFFLTADLFGNMGFYGSEKTSDYFQKTKIQETISSDRGHFRTFSTVKTISMDTPILIKAESFLTRFKEKHLPSMNLLHRVHDLWGNDVIRLKREDDLYKALTGAPSVTETNLIDVYGVKYVISVAPIEEDARFELIDARLEGLEGRREDLLKENTIKLYRKREPLQRAWLVRDFKVLESNQILSTIVSKDFDPNKMVLLEEDPPHPIPLPKREEGREREGGPLNELQDRVEFVNESNNQVKLFVKATRDALLVLSDTYFPGWKAYVSRFEQDSPNGDKREEKEILRANYNFRAVPLEAGENEVEFVYDPSSFKLGAFISFLGVAGCVLGLTIRRPTHQNHPNKG